MSAATLIGGLVALAAAAAPALANAPNPTSTTGSVVNNGNGTYTLTVQGNWDWASQTNCPTQRDGVGYNVDWFDNTVNPIGNSNSPNGVLYVGDSTDNIVHSLQSLNNSGDLTWNGVPSSYLTHNTTNRAPTSTDAQNWVSNCGNTNSTTKLSSGTWGPISHTYSSSGPFTVCAVMYDPHGHGTASGGTIGSSSVKDITAGGNTRNDDNSYEANGTGTNGNQCSTVTFNPPANNTPTAPGTPTTTTTTTTTTSPTTVKKTTKHKKKKKKHVKAKKVSRKPKVKSGFTG